MSDLPAPVDEPVFIVRIAPLIRPNTLPGVAKVDTTQVIQFEDLEVVHPLNGGKTAKVTVSMDAGEWVADLEPWQQALWIGLVRPGNTEAEGVFFGQCNVKDDYTAGTILLEAQDASQKMQHHYLVQGDDPLTLATTDPDTGILTADGAGIDLLLSAAQNTTAQNTRDMPSLGCFFFFDDSTTHPFYALQVERGQEIDALFGAISSHAAGPDLDYRTPWWNLDAYNYIDAYDELGRDLSASIVLGYGYVEDNLEGLQVNPGRPTTHAHFLDADRRIRRTAAHIAGSNETGAWVDFVATDMVLDDSAAGLLLELAKARVGAYGRPPKFTDTLLRPDAVLGVYYGHPTWTEDAEPGVGNTNGDIYIGDTVRVRGTRGYRSFDTPARITEITLSQPGAHGPAVMAWKLLPVLDGVELDTEEQG